MTQRESWREFICDPNKAGRHLSGVGNSAVSAAGPEISRATLASFLERLSNAQADATTLAEAVDLAYAPYHEFCTHHLSGLLGRLTTETRSDDAVVGPSLRGVVRWGPTIAGRRSGRLLPTQFCVRLPYRSTGTPENVVLRWLLSSLVDGVAGLETRLGSVSLPLSMLTMRRACELALKDDRLSFSCTTGEVPSHQDIITTARHRLPSYRMAATLAQRRLPRRSGNRAGRWLRMLDLLAVEWLEPVQDEDLFELFTLTAVLDVLEIEVGLGPPVV